MKKAHLILSNGMVFEGTSIGAENTLFGELVFNTSMTGYQEILTDPTYTSQVIVMTYPEIGNTGINFIDSESDRIHARGLIIKNYCYNESHYQATMTLKDFLIQNNVVGISGIDTRALTRILRKSGTMNCVITTEPVTDKLIDELERYEVSKDVVLLATRNKITRFLSEKKDEPVIKAAAIDYGTPASVFKSLAEAGFDLTVYPADTDSETILRSGSECIILTDGPGNPEDCRFQIKTIKNLAGKTPIYGFGLGGQLLALALNAKTYKLNNRHCGGNYPVIDLQTGKVMITQQNRSYAVYENSLNGNIRQTYKNLNDGTLEGFYSEKLKAGAIQFYSDDIYEKIYSKIKKIKNNATITPEKINKHIEV